MLRSCMFAIAVAYKLREARIQAVCRLHVRYMHAACKLHASCANATVSVYRSGVKAARRRRADCLQPLQATPASACAEGGSRKSLEFCRIWGRTRGGRVPGTLAPGPYMAEPIYFHRRQFFLISECRVHLLVVVIFVKGVFLLRN